jgi:hypothetical protein
MTWRVESAAVRALVMRLLKFELQSRRLGTRQLERGLLHPIDHLRRRANRGRLRVELSGPEVRRGGELDARVTIADSRGLADVEMGLVCTEFYACRMSGHGDGGGGRGTSSATAYEAWLPVDGRPGVHAVRVTVPAEAPFSYDGELLCFKWELVARGRRKRRLDAQARQEVVVRP